MIAGRHIICFASDWSYDPTSKHHVMRLLSACNHVLWVNYHGSRRPSASAADVRSMVGKLGRFIQGPRRVNDHMTVLTPLVVPSTSPAARRINRALLLRQVRAVLRTLPEAPLQLWSFAPDVGALRGAFNEELFVYYCVDEFSQFSGYDAAQVRAAERDTLAAADLVVTTSRELYDAKRPFNANTVLVPHGVDLEHFATAPSCAIPADVADLSSPVLGFFGIIHDWVDVPLLADVARRRPDWSMALIGEARTDVSALRGLPNVRLLGRRPYAALPAYGRAFSVGLIPFRMNGLTRAVNPIKLREYLAAGLPVVATPLPEAQRFAPWVECAADADAFVAACARAIGSRDDVADECRREAVKSEAWPVVVGRLSQEVRRTIGSLARPRTETCA